MKNNQNNSLPRNPSAAVFAPEDVWQQQAQADGLLAKAFSRHPVDVEKLKHALQSGAHPDRMLYDGLPPLHVALTRGELLAAGFLLAAGANINAMDADGTTALDLAAQRGDRDSVLLLREYFKATETDPAKEIWDKYSYQREMDVALMEAARIGATERVRAALALGADPDAVSVYEQFRYTPLHWAVMHYSRDMVELLLEAGADPSRRSAYGETAADLMWNAPARTLFTPEWERVFSLLHEKAGGDLFFRDPCRLTLEDLRRPAPCERLKNTRLIQVLVEQGHVGRVFDILKADPKARLHVEDFLIRSSDFSPPESLLEAFTRAGMLPRVFSPEIWQGRLGEMLELQKYAENSYVCTLYVRSQKIDFAAAAKAVLEYGQNELRQRARGKIPRLKPGGPQ